MHHRASKLRAAYRAGIVSGAQSVFSVTGKGRPAPPLVHRASGSLRDDAKQLRHDSDRLFRGRHA